MSGFNPKSKLQLSDGDHDPVRRSLIGGMAGIAGLAAMAPLGRANAMAAKTGGEAGKAAVEEEEVFNAFTSRPREFLKGEMDSGEPWTASQTGNFDLEDPLHNNLAKLKMTCSLVGDRIYVPMLARMVLARYDEPGALTLGIASMFTWQLQVPTKEEFGDFPEGTALMRSMYTAVYLDPETMEPVTELKNKLTGKMMKLEDYMFVENFLTYPLGGSRMVGEEQFANDSADVPRTTLIKNWGDELILYSGGIYNEPGLHQPRFTENNWTCDREGVMDPDTPSVRAQYALMGANKAYEKPWMGYTTDDPEFLATLARGKKVHSAEELPDIHKKVLAERYPHRL